MLTKLVHRIGMVEKYNIFGFLVDKTHADMHYGYMFLNGFSFDFKGF
jgi:hypothetical protein